MIFYRISSRVRQLQTRGQKYSLDLVSENGDFNPFDVFIVHDVRRWYTKMSNTFCGMYGVSIPHYLQIPYHCEAKMPCYGI